MLAFGQETDRIILGAVWPLDYVHLFARKDSTINSVHRYDIYLTALSPLQTSKSRLVIMEKMIEKREIKTFVLNGCIFAYPMKPRIKNDYL